MRTKGLLTLLIAAIAAGQDSPSALAKSTVDRWAEGFGSGHTPRSPGLAEVIRTSPGQAVLLISGVPRSINSGDATLEGRRFSGVIEAAVENGLWKLGKRIPLEDMGRILAHDLKVSIRPALGLTVEDRMRIRVTGTNGFAVRLNHSAKLTEVRAAGLAVKFFFGGGLLWADLPPGDTGLTLRYGIDVEEGPDDTNSGCFLRKAGHVRNQYFWHPFFDFNSLGDQADFNIEVRIPKAYRLSTSIPQTDRLEGEERIVTGRSIRPTFALTLAYDRDWKVQTESLGGLRLQLFITPEFRPTAPEIVKEFQAVHALLSSRFGDPRASYFGVVEARAKQGNGWHFASNQIVVAAGRPPEMSTNGNRPVANLGHEIAHLWTQGSGPAANFLREGWATYAESVILTSEFGPDAAKKFWTYEAADYFSQFEGKASLLEDPNNGGVAYTKGAWLFHMLEDAMGSGRFQKATTEFSSRSLQAPAGWETLAECAQRNAPPDFDARAFLLPWLTGKSAPRLTASADVRTVTIHQEAPYFTLPVVVEATTAQGPEHHRVWIAGAETKVTFFSVATDPRIDPDGLLLVKR